MGMFLFMKDLDHAVGIGETGGIEVLASPVVLPPVVPVQDDIIQRDLSSPEFLYRVEYLILGLIPFPALPEAQGPPGDDGRLAGQGAVAGDGLVHIPAIDKIIIQLPACLR